MNINLCSWKLTKVVSRKTNNRQASAYDHQAKNLVVAGGNVDYSIDAAAFPGIYGEMAREANEIAQSHITVTRKVIEVVERYAAGAGTRNWDLLIAGVHFMF